MENVFTAATQDALNQQEPSDEEGDRGGIMVRIAIRTLVEQSFNFPPFPVAYEFLVQAIRNLVGQLSVYSRMPWELHISANHSRI